MSGIFLLVFLIFIAAVNGVSDCGNSCQGMFRAFVSDLFTNDYIAGVFTWSIIFLIAGTILTVWVRRRYSKSKEKSLEIEQPSNSSKITR
ncbi:MAG: hypothetical protein ACREBS_05155 [Nitrososphaerales archaeon]